MYNLNHHQINLHKKYCNINKLNKICNKKKYESNKVSPFKQ